MADTRFDALRQKMVEEQLIPRGIHDTRVLEAFRSVERHKFVPAELEEGAYADHPLPIGGGQTISQPYIVALMTQSLRLKGNEKVLEIGTGSGYQAAILARLSKEVYTVERMSVLAERTQRLLKGLGYDNVFIRVADGTKGWKEHAPYDGIIVTAAAPKLPQAYTEQLKVGGRLVIPVGSRFSQRLTIAENTKSGIITSEICGCVFVPLIGENGW